MLILNIRYADDFIIGVNGSKEDCIQIKSELSAFIATRLKMTLSEEKTLITHSGECARFLGYDVRVRRNSAVKRGSRGHVTMRTLNNKTELLIPQKDKIRKFLFDRKIVKQDKKRKHCAYKPCIAREMYRTRDCVAI